ncbi:uncharacterized protein Z518_01055 [Rhinocladiella mackenziei CBS 650.93]|uniref:Major facilitator superfamily (MFS) profile domain-containing protein n=1 Tax=Rhinocladiella mackenziei CBS 650.93 TaxID=1442369 RepID=A0A0D2IV92_9EURO|nr:uncharacterized protein Z518_01055 [Rhinocladiella mackenziei CBS 650.93]KIX09974.1 hypothetical protein Z518_01055 [Rhinocladiella mackenziei CBS 650.93]
MAVESSRTEFKVVEAGLSPQETVLRSSSSSISEESREAFLSSFTAEEDRRIMRKVDKRFLLIIGLMYMLKNVDYTNAASVKVLQVGEPRNILIELGMTADQYNWVQTIYFISYIIFEVPSNLLLKKMTPRHWQSRIIASWGLVLACHAAVTNKEGLYAARFFLGMMEAGLFPGLAAQLCSWYRSDEMGKPIMWMFGFQNCSGIVGSIIAYGISYMNGLSGLSAWQWVYLLEGLFTILFAGVVFLVLPDYPKSKRSSKWLTLREQEYLELRLTANAPRTHEPAFRKAEVLTSLRDPRTYSFCLAQILMNLGGYALSWQLPTVTTSLGFTGLPRNQLLNIPPAAASVLSIIFAGWFLSRAYLTRPVFIMFICAGALAFFIVLAVQVSRTATYIALKGATGTAFTLAFQSCIGQVGGAIGPQLFPSRFAHNGYKTSFIICAASIGASWVANLWTWYLTDDTEKEVQRVRRLRIKANKEGGVWAGEDAKL